MSSLSLLHINVNSLAARRTELGLYVTETKPDIICMNETRMNGKPYPKFCDYTLASFRDRAADAHRHKGGGVAIYVRSNITHDDISPSIDDITAIKIKVGNIEYAIVAYYCPPVGGGPEFDVKTITEFVNQYDNLVIMGDLNAKHQFFGSSHSDARGDALFDLVERHDMMVANNPDQATKLSQSNEALTIIDYAIISKSLIGRLTECCTGEDVGSDHLPLHLHLQTNAALSTVPTRLVRPLAKCDWDRFVLNLSHMQIQTTSTNQSDIDQKVLVLEETIKEALDIACPMKEVKNYNFQCSANTMDLIRRKRRFRRLAQKDLTYKKEFNRLQRLVKSRLDQERLNSWHTATEGLNHLQGKQFWDSFKRLSQAQKKAQTCPKLTLTNGEKSKEPQTVAAEFAKTLQSAHQMHEGPLFDYQNKTDIDRFIRKNKQIFTPNFDTPPERHALLEPIDMAELTSALDKCKSRGSPGPDGLSFIVLKHLPDNTLGVMLSIFNECLIFGYFPGRWKNAHGVMLPKPGKDHSSPSSYRPISLLNTTGKLFERIVNRRLMGHLSDISFFNEWQRAYLPNKEASEIVYRLTEEIKEASKHQKWFTTAFSLDVEKAFDSVWHNGLKYKLYSLGLPDGMCRLLSSFLHERTISVRIHPALSPPVPLQAGTPQGSVLSPLLFLIYVNDIPLDSSELRAGQFADDITAWRSGTKKDVMQLKIQRTLNSIQAWCSKWRIKLNVEKTQMVTFKSRKYVEQFYIFREEIEETSSLKVLGVKIGKFGSLLEHCKERAAMANQRTNLLRMLRGKGWGANVKTLTQLYIQYIRPVLEHGAVVTAEASDAQIKLLEVAERKALRVILQTPLKFRNADLYAETGIQPIKERLAMLREKSIFRYGDRVGIQHLENTKKLMAAPPHG